MLESFGDDRQIQTKRPMLDVKDVRLYTVRQICRVTNFPAQAHNLSQTSDPRLDQMTEMISLHDPGKIGIVFRKMRTRADNAHVSDQHINELRKLIDTGFPHKFTKFKYARILLRRLLRLTAMSNVHGTEFEEHEMLVSNA